MTCLCKLCAYYRQVLLVRNYGNAAAKQHLIDELYENLDYAEFELEVWEAIGAGKWPSARQYAEVIIKRCDAIEAKAKDEV